MFQVFSSSQAFVRRAWLCLSLSLLAVLGSASNAHAQGVGVFAPVIKGVFTTIPSAATRALPEYNGSHFYSVTWDDLSTNEDFYIVELQIVGPGYNLPWRQYGTALAPNTTSFFPVFDDNIPDGTHVQFRVSACQGTLDNNLLPTRITAIAKADHFVAYTRNEDVNFAAPTGFAVNVVAGSDGRLHFAWNDNTNKEEGYQLFVYNTSAPNTDPTGDPKLTFNFGNGPPDIVLPGLTAGSTYYMRLCASRAQAYLKNSSGAYVRDTNGQAQVQTYTRSAFSNEVSLTMPSTLKAPTGLTATPLSENKLRLAWKNNSDNADSYVVQYRYSSSDTFTELGSTGVTQTVDVPGYPGITTEWQVVAAQAAQGSIPRHVSAASNSATITLPFNPPSDLKATFSADPTTFRPVANLTWTDNSLVEGAYSVYAKPSGSSSQAQRIFIFGAPNLTSGQVKASAMLLPGTAYDFSVAAYDANSGKESAPSNTSTAISFDGITSLEYAPATYQQAFGGYQLTATSTNSSRVSWSITGLPPGLVFNESSGTITETVAGAGPQKAGLFLCPMTVTYANGWVDHKKLALRIQRLNGAPLTPLTIGSRVVGTSVVSLPLGEYFSDPDTEAALRMYTSQGNIDILFQPSLTPETYANFMAYVNAGDYNGTAFHRVSPGNGSPGDIDYSAPFVIQGGGYKPTTAPNNFAGVASRPSPTNEPGIPNVQGTIALAKSTDPDSGTHDFFISLSDNRTILDNSMSALDQSRLLPNGGFTAFARRAKTSPSAATETAIKNMRGLNSYSINLTPAGSSSAQTFQPIADAGLGVNTFWPLNSGTVPPNMDNTLCSLIQSFSALPVLSYDVLSNSDSGAVTATIDAQNNLLVTGVTEAGTATIVVRATDLDGNVTTQTFNVLVDGTYIPVSIDVQPTATPTAQGQDVVMSVHATGSATLAYQWRKNGEPLAGETSSTLILHAVDASSIGDYRVAVSNSANLVVSDVVHLTVLLKPLIESPPLAKTVNYNSPATFSVVASGNPDLSYKWYKNEELIPGATSATYTIAHALMTDAGMYKVIIHNSIGDATSVPVGLTVNRIDSDGDGLYDDEEVALGLLPSKADTDGDGYNDSLELSVGTDPRVGSSTPVTQYFVAQKDKVAALATLAMKNIPQKLNFIDFLLDKPGDPTQAVTVPQQWMATTEMTNEQFASVLEIALHQMNALEIVSTGGRRYVRYPKTTGEIICYLAPLPSDPPVGNSPPSCDIGADETGTTFYVPKTLARKPVRAVTWYGAYLASAALNAYYGYADKNQPGWAYHPTLTVKGYRVPYYPDWEWAANSGAANYLYPTGATLTPALANYGNTTATAGPKIVGSYAPNKLGLYDMGGNVAEWIYEQTTIPASGYVRGGSFASPGTELKNLSAVATTRSTISDKVGVRLVLTEDTIPRIVTPPVDQFVKVGDAVTLSVTAAGPPPLTYQWLKNNVVMAGKTSATLSIPSAQLADAGNYTVKVITNGAGFVTSAARGLSVLNSPASVPVTVVLPNKTATLAVAMAAAPGQLFTFAWKKVNGASMGDVLGTTAKLTLPTVTNSSTGSYVCTITPVNKPTLPTASVSADLIVLKAPALSGNPATVTLATGVVGGYYSLNVFSNLFDTSTDRAPSSFVIKGLPAGLTFDPKTGLIYGRPTTVGQTSGITITAINGVGSATVSAVIELEIKPMPAAAKGTFVAGIDPQAVLNNNLGGRLDFTTSATGYYTGKLTLAGTVYPITGYLGATVTTTNSVATVSTSARTSILITRPGKTSLVLDVTADFASATRPLTGSVGELVPGTSSVVNTAAVGGWRSLDYSGATASSVGRKGYHTMIFDPPATSTDANLAPQGTSFVTASVADTGVVTLGGKLADGTAVTGSCVMSSGGNVLLFQSLYAAKGSVYGYISIGNAANHPVTVIGPALSWTKNATADRNYKSGFTPAALGLVLAEGGLYTPPAANAAVMGLPDSTDASNAEAVFSSGGLTPPFSQTFCITPKNLTIMRSGIFNSRSVTFSVVPGTGVFTGTFTIPGTPARKASFSGVITHKKGDANANKTRGYGSFTLPQALPTATTSPILSGAVVLKAYPND